MTIIAGAYAFEPTASLDPFELASMHRFFEGLADSGVVERWDTSRAIVFKWDSGAYREPAWTLTGDGSLVTMVGDALLAPGGKRLSRTEQLQRLQAEDGSLDATALASSRGVFAALRFDAQTCQLSIATDVIGIRPIYYAVQQGVLFFSSALHLLEALPGLQRELDERGLAEYLAFSFSLSDRTPYRSIRLLTESTQLQVGPAGVRCAQYFDWNETAVVEESPDDCAHRLFGIFDDAIQLRRDGSGSAHAFLSGGMDSRAIVAALAAQGCAVQAYNFSPDHTQDQVFARNYAQVLGQNCALSFHPRPSAPNFSLLAASVLVSGQAASPSGERMLWSGDGGSVCLGSVYMDAELMDLARAGAWKAAALAFLAKNKVQVPERLLAPSWRAKASTQLARGVQAEIQRYHNGDAGRGLYFFLLFNDQRRHLSQHFETQHRHGLEFHLPFFDSLFVRGVVQSPSAWGLAHHLYNRWFSCFPPVTRATPWQTYPGHEPCPLQSDAALGYQWSAQTRASARPGWAQRRGDSAVLLRLAGNRALAQWLAPGPLVSAALVHGTGMRDLGYLASAARRLSSLRAN